jgi:hypothetical protein
MFLAPPETIRGMRNVFGDERVVKVEFQDEGSRLMKAF